MKFTQTAVIETELPPEADVADFVNGDGDTEPERDIFDEALQLTKEAVDIAIENREAEADSPPLDVGIAIEVKDDPLDSSYVNVASIPDDDVDAEIQIEQDFRVQLEWSGSRKMAQQDTFRWMYRFWEKNLKPKRGKKSTVTVPELTSTLPGMATTEQQIIQSILDTI